MEYNEDRDLLKVIPTFTLPPPPRFDAAASAAARPVEPLPRTRILIGFYQKPNLFRLINRRAKRLALVAIVSLATGAAGGMLVVQRDRQQRLIDSSSMIQMSNAQLGTPEITASPSENTNASLEVSQPIENPIRVRRSHRRVRRGLTSAIASLSNADDEDRDRDKVKDDEEDKAKKDDERKEDRDRERSRKDRADSHTSDRTRQGAALYDLMRVRKP